MKTNTRKTFFALSFALAAFISSAQTKTPHVFSFNGRFGVFSSEGILIVPPFLEAVGDFSDGLAPVRFSGSSYGIVNPRSGAIKLPFFDMVSYEPGSSLSTGIYRCGTYNDKDDRPYIFNASGYFLFAPGSYRYIGPFVSGFAWIAKGTEIGVMDDRGRLILPLEYKAIATEPVSDGPLSDGVFLVRKSDSWVLLSPSGEELKNLGIYQEIKAFSEGFAPAKRGDAWGFIDKTGAEVIPFIYGGASCFSEGLAAVWKADASFHAGYVDKNGKEPFGLPYAGSEAFREGFAIVQGNSKEYLINKSGKPLEQKGFAKLHPTSDGVARFEEDGKTGYFDARPARRMDVSYDKGADFHSGFALVSMGGKVGIIDKEGRERLACVHKDIIRFANGSYLVIESSERHYYLDAELKKIAEGSDKNLGKKLAGKVPFAFLGPETAQKIGYINAAGELAIAPRWVKSYGFSEDLAGFLGEEGAGYIKTNGELAFKVPDATELGSYSGGFAIIKKGSAYYYIDSRGGEIGGPFDGASNFQEGLALVKSGDRIGFIDKSGKFKIHEGISGALDFSEGLAEVMLNGKLQFINTKGTSVFTSGYDKVNSFSNGLALFYDPAMKLYGYIDKKGQTLIAASYSKAGDFSDGLARVYDGKRWGYIDTTGKLVLAYQYKSATDFMRGVALVDGPEGQGFIDKSGKTLFSYR